MFRKEALPLIDEERFAEMYSADMGRPNRAVQTVLGCWCSGDVRSDGHRGPGGVGVQPAVASRAGVGDGGGTPLCMFVCSKCLVPLAYSTHVDNIPVYEVGNWASNTSIKAK